MATIPLSKYDLVERLYYDEQKTMKEIAEHLGVPIDAVTYFMRKYTMPRRSFSEANKVVFEKKKPSFKLRQSKSQKAKTLEIAGAMLYWAEGYKTGKATGIDFANSDPDMISIFVNFLRSRYTLDEKRLRGMVYCYANQQPSRLIKFWSDVTGIPKGQFIKPYVRRDFRKDGRKMKYGLVHVRYADKKLLKDMLNLIDSYTQTLRR